jgi:XTP/dITP diphosphohydrolase
LKLILATGNRSKVKEIVDILAPTGLEILSLDAYPSLVLPPETGSTFKENAIAKARFVTSATGIAALADDSGLEVDALSGAPGVHSARYAGEEATDEENWTKLLKELAGVTAREARFKCVMALVIPGERGSERSFEGTLEGSITLAPAGLGGFGYDPVFFVAGTGKTAAELTREEKNAISHRAGALAGLKNWLDEAGRIS